MDAAAADNGGGKSEDDTATPACEEAPPADPEPLADPPSPPPHAAPRKAVVDMAEDFSEEAVAVTTLRIPVDTAGQPVSAVPFPAWSLPLGPCSQVLPGRILKSAHDHLRIPKSLCFPITSQHTTLNARTHTPHTCMHI